jgi:hypothetical protein
MPSQQTSPKIPTKRKTGVVMTSSSNDAFLCYPSRSIRCVKTAKSATTFRVSPNGFLKIDSAAGEAREALIPKPTPADSPSCLRGCRQGQGGPAQSMATPPIGVTRRATPSRSMPDVKIAREDQRAEQEAPAGDAGRRPDRPVRTSSPTATVRCCTVHVILGRGLGLVTVPARPTWSLPMSRTLPWPPRGSPRQPRLIQNPSRIVVSPLLPGRGTQ